MYRFTEDLGRLESMVSDLAIKMLDALGNDDLDCDQYDALLNQIRGKIHTTVNIGIYEADVWHVMKG